MSEALDLKTPGTFHAGCNYWASHAGTAMWTEWRPEVVEEDFRALSKAGVEVLRVFPLWPDFQPLVALSHGAGRPLEFSHGEEPLPDDDAGRAGISEEAMRRFEEFAALAERHGLALIVGLVTGWMSGRLFAPQPFLRSNLLTDPEAVQWQVRFARYFVRRMRAAKAIVAWELGNECNCMGEVSRPEAWTWSSAIRNAIRAEDASRPILSGMHGLSPAPGAAWNIQDQAELTDILTVHPYPAFTPHCDYDPINTIRSVLHSTAEARFYADIGRRPCLIEELGTLGPMISDDATAAAYLRCALFSAWAHDCHGLLWWCGFDQAHLTRPPYDWCACERELGLFRADCTPKAVAGEMAAFRRFLDGLPIRSLPQRNVDAVCILTAGQDQWAAAFGSFILAKQAGFDVEFQYADQPLREAALYLLPSIAGHNVLSRRQWVRIMERTRAGASLYVSQADGFLSFFEEVFGAEVGWRERRSGAFEVRMENMPETPALTMANPFRSALRVTRAQALGREADGTPVFTVCDYGKGKAYFLAAPIECELIRRPGSFHGPGAQPFWRIYRHIAREIAQRRAIRKDSPEVGVTEHDLGPSSRAVVMVNYGAKDCACLFELDPAWQIAEVWHGPHPGAQGGKWQCRLPANGASVFRASGG